MVWWVAVLGILPVVGSGVLLDLGREPPPPPPAQSSGSPALVSPDGRHLTFMVIGGAVTAGHSVDLLEDRDRVQVRVRLKENQNPGAYPAWGGEYPVSVRLSEPLGARRLEDGHGRPVPVDRLPQGCALPDPGPFRSAAIVERIEVAAGGERLTIKAKVAKGAATNAIMVTECTDRVFVSVLAHTRNLQDTTKVEVTVPLRAPLGGRHLQKHTGLPFGNVSRR